MTVPARVESEVAYRLPTYLIVGAMKAGTSTMQRAIGGHPDVFVSRPKELHFFVEHRNWQRGLSWYREQFADSGSAKAIGEASVTYTQWPIVDGVPGRIASVLPDVRIIYLVREPVERMLSHYKQELHANREFRPLEQALREVPKYLAYSGYATQIERYLEHFPRDQMLVLPSERYFADPDATLRRVFSFIGVDPDAERARSEGVNQSDRKSAPLPVVRQLRQVAPVQGALRTLPSGARQWLKARLPRHELAAESLHVPPALADDLRAALQDEMRRLRQYVDSDFDCWGIA